ncbi:hypothetical protein ER57_00890 [Smithella sp. SCADC]|jgi:hypothetical protein|nr:hypothetical protein ER57_11165 [Smithella sp. SCADC]KFO68898.1 hypothetical protein ER57_00890 [Smithella sp. SCADC]
MKQHEAVIRAMEDNGGYATLALLNQNVLRVEDCEWKTKTPFASIRRIVQDERFFFKIRPGLWALKTYKDKLPPEILPRKGERKEKIEEYSHAYYQGLLVELGNFKKFKTFVPSQDKNRIYLGKKLSEIATISEIFKFSYDRILRKAKTIDVLWFNEREMPASLFEIEHSTDIQNSLLKFVELQDFHASFCIVANEVRKKEFQAKLSLGAFKSINERVNFLNYDDVAELHTKTSEYVIIESKLRF